MDIPTVLSLILLACAGIAFVRPQWISTIRHYTDAERRNIDMRRVRRSAGGGLLALALLTGPVNRLLARHGIPETTLTALRIIVLFIGAIAIAACVETYNRNK